MRKISKSSFFKEMALKEIGKPHWKDENRNTTHWNLRGAADADLRGELYH